MRTTLDPARTAIVLDQLGRANQAFREQYPGESSQRQPLHTVYGGAHLFKAETATKLGKIGLRVLREYAPTCAALARILRLPSYEDIPDDGPELDALLARMADDPEGVRAESFGTWLAHTVYERTVAKMETEPVEDFRIDFEDGFGNRPDSEEDEHAERTAKEVARGLKEGCLPPFIGIRIKPFSDDLKQRSIRTLDIFLSTLLHESGGVLPEKFFITLPKVTIPAQVTACVEVLEELEQGNGLAPGSLKLELMIEVTQSILDAQGRSNLPILAAACKGRCVSAHFGTYDYTASCNITAEHQVMDHPVCDFAKHMMMVAFAGTGIFLSDGATNVMPTPPHRGESLTDSQKAENARVVHRAWKLAYDHIRHSLLNGFYQGWDLHPAQLPIRYAACYGFFLEGLEAASVRLTNFIDKAAQATLVGDVFDDAATGQGLLNYFLRALNSGAITVDDVQATGLTLEEVQGRSFLKILANRRQS